jgi:hypothetical protein
MVSSSPLIVMWAGTDIALETWKLYVDGNDSNVPLSIRVKAKASNPTMFPFDELNASLPLIWQKCLLS